jgi:hypothetical protein
MLIDGRSVCEVQQELEVGSGDRHDVAVRVSLIARALLLCDFLRRNSFAKQVGKVDMAREKVP